MLAKLTPQQLRLDIQAWSSKVSPGYLESIAGTFEKLFDILVSKPTQSLAEVNLLGQRHQQMIEDWSIIPQEPLKMCVNDVVYSQVSERPQHEAVCAWDGAFTYADMWTYVRRLADTLVELGVGPEDIVPLAFVKSKWYVVAMLAVLEAGAAFCPLDGAQPTSRLRRMASRLRARVSLCSPEFEKKMQEITENIYSVDGTTFETSTQASSRKSNRAKYYNPVYILWTSGSTGEPKGVVIEHSAFCSSAAKHAPDMHLRADSRVLQFSHFVFDASIVECLTTLMTGATICIPSEESRMNALEATINQLRASWADLTPSVVDFVSPSAVPTLKTLVLMGEAMSQEHLDTWSSIDLLNAYGPAECSVAAIVNQDLVTNKEPVMIGRGIGVQCWVVDPENESRLVPPGCPGELYIEGPTLARGYLDDPERTRLAFIEAPPWSHRGESRKNRRLYKTGDLVRHNTRNGLLYFIGRKDSQVKVHGQRVEIGEIEYHVGQMSLFQQSMILLPKAGTCKGRLTAVISLEVQSAAQRLMDTSSLRLASKEYRDTHQPTIAKARETLLSKLPNFMIPSIWLLVTSIPLLKSGKIDRKHVMNGVQGISEEDFAEYFQVEDYEMVVSNPLESDLRSVWGNALNLKAAQVSLESSFLSLGGDSISAIMVQSECKKRNLGLTVRDIMGAKSIRQLVKAVRTVHQTFLSEEKIEEEFDLSPIQSLFFQQPDQGQGHFNQSMFLRLTKYVKSEQIHFATKSIVNRHSMLRARFKLSEFDDEWKQRITLDVAGSYRFKSHRCTSKEASIPLMGETQKSLDPVDGPLFAMDVFELDDGSQLLFMTGHHLVIDLVSWRVILQDLEDLLLDPRMVSRPEQAFSFQSWCRSQLEHCSKLALKTVLPAVEIPKHDAAYWGMEDESNLYGDVECLGFEIEPEATNSIVSVCNAFMQTDTVDMLTAALLHSFSKIFKDRPAPAIYNEGHGREVWDEGLDLSQTVGWFTTMYPIICAEAGSHDFTDVLRRVKDFRRAVPANGRPYFASRMLTKGGSRKYGRDWPLEVAFNYLGIYQQLEREGALLVPAEEMAGEARGAGGKADVGQKAIRFALFEISAVIAHRRLRFSFTYNRKMKHQESFEAWMNCCRDTLISAPDLLSRAGFRATLSDYPLIQTNYQSLDRLLGERLPEIGVADIGNVENIYTCSQIQQGLLISTQRDAGSYAVHGIYRVKANDGLKIDEDRLVRAWQQVVGRHPSLRTLFVESLSEGDSLYDQVVLRKVSADVTKHEAQGDTAAIELLSSLPAIEYRANSPPHRLAVCKSSTGNVFCRLEISHTIMDGTSMSIIFRDIISCYQGQKFDTQSPLYSDYIAFLKSLPPGAGIGYWKSYLADAESCCFPVLIDDSGDVDRQLRSKHFDLDLSKLQIFCNLHDVTMANLFHTAWAITLQCYTGSSDVVFGYLTSTRDSSIKNVENLVGYLVNMLICRVTFNERTPLITVMKQVQSDLSESQAHCQTALSEVLHAMNVSGAVFFNTSLSYRKLPLSSKESQAMSLEDCCPYYDPTEYGVSINIEQSEEKAAVDLDYWTDSLSDGHAINVMNTFLRAIDNLVECSELDLAQVDCMSASDQQIISGWNRSIPPVVDKCVHEIIESEASIRPSASAICGWDGNFTYAELDATAEKLASYLTLLGVRPETISCLCFEKSTYTIVAMLAVLKAGGAFCSLDPMHPKTALDHRITDTKCKIILTSPCYSSMFGSESLDVVAVDHAFLDKLPQSLNTNSSFVEPQNPCCVIYTSGSTGKPKGVVLEHRALATSSRAHGSALGIGRESRFLQFSSYTFDNSLEEIFTTLMRGGVVCVPSDHERLNDLAGAATRLEANFMDLTPTVATYLVPAEMPTIKGLALGGEALTKNALDVWGDKVEIHNQYGPSECSINSTHRTGIHRASDPSSIGRSVGSVSWIVDPSDHHRLQPIGCEGELLIEGPILARGYLNNLEKTTEVFIEEPKWTSNPRFKVQPEPRSRRMYKTGDLVRYNSDGSINYLGRKDQQVKLHGQRIELGEIEYHARNSLQDDWHFAIELITPGVAANAAKALAVFVSPQEERSTTATVIKRGFLPMSTILLTAFKNLEASLAKALPKHMVPSMFIALESLPLTTSGKLDRRQLHALAKTMNENQISMYRLAASSGQEPSSHMEKILARLWEQVLNLEKGSIGVDAQFFRMGGDSIAAIRLVSAARAEGITLSVAKIFQSATLSDMAQTSAHSDEDTNSLPNAPSPFSLLSDALPVSRITDEICQICGIDRDQVEDIYPCTPIQEGLIALSRKQPGAYIAQNVYLLESIDIPRFKEAWDLVYADESILRTRVIHSETLGFLQVVVRDSIEWAEELEDNVAPENDLHSYSENGACLTGFKISRNMDDQAVFTWTVHHALYDGWSVQLVLNKVRGYYDRSIRPGSVDQIPYSAFMQYLLRTDVLQSEAFWQSNLAGSLSLTFPALPSSIYQPHVTNKASHSMEFSRKPGSAHTTPSMIRAAWALTVAAYSNSTDVIFAETVANRDAPVTGIVDMIGPTFATVPVRVRADPDLTAEDFVGMIQKSFIDAMPHQNLGLHRIKRINSECARACGFQNLIVINSDAPSSEEEFWRATTDGTASSDFFTYALTVSFDIAPSNIQITAHFDPTAIPEWQIRRLLSYFEIVLSRINDGVRRSQQTHSLQTIPPNDLATIKDWNSQIPNQVHRCIHDIISERANGGLGSCKAIEGWDGNFTYRQLNDAATSLAKFFSTQGVRQQDFVPVCFEKSTMTVVVMLAILKLGAAFVPLDSDSPKARLQNILSDIGASTIICSPRTEKVTTTLGIQSVVVDHRTIRSIDVEISPLPTARGEDIAYVIFTSGSTGKPKGTLVSHTAFVSGATAHGPAMNMSAVSRVLQFSSYTFDASVMEIFSTLMMGGCICVPDDFTRLNDISKAIREMEATWALLTPSFAQNLVPSDVPSLRTLVLGGEAMSQNHITTWADKLHLVNAYGPSECAVVAAVQSHVLKGSYPANIGKAVGSVSFIANKSDHNELVPVGAVGELLLCGPTLASGYLNNIAKTKESFVTAPGWINYFPQSKTREEVLIYKTGDLVKYAEDGSLVFIGRKDTQAKFHGQRLELGEIEHYLNEVPQLKHGMALMPSRGCYEKKLISVISSQEQISCVTNINGICPVPREHAASLISKGQDVLSRYLPPYMVPSTWIMLQNLPLLPSGKLDRRKLEAWVEDIDEATYRTIAGGLNSEILARGSEIEEHLREIWRKILNLDREQVGLDKNFLYLGGDSISAMQVASLGRKEGLGISVQDVIRSRSISDLAMKVDLPKAISYSNEELDRAFKLSPIQKLFFKWVGDEYNHFNQSVAISINKRISAAKISSTIANLTKRHSMLRARFAQDDAGEWYQKLDRDGHKTSVFNVHADKYSEAQIKSLVNASQASLNIQEGPLMAVNLFENGISGKQTLCLAVHHLVVDVISWSVMLQDLEDSLCSRQQTPPSIPFQVWCKLQEEHTQSARKVEQFGEIPAADLSFWNMKDKPNSYGSVVNHELTVEETTTASILGSCNRPLKTEVIDVLLGCLLYSFCKAFPERRAPPAIYNEAHGRESWEREIDLTHTVGWFTTICPVYLPSEATTENLSNIIRWVKDQRSRYMGKGREYFAQRMLTGDHSYGSDHWPMEIAFNYLGQEKAFQKSGSVFKPLDRLTSESDVGPSVPRFALIEISASVADGQLKISLGHSQTLGHQAKVGTWMTEIKNAVEFASTTLPDMSPQTTLSNFPLAPLAFDSIEKLEKQIVPRGIPSLADVEDVYGCSSMQQGILLSQVKNTAQYMYQSIFTIKSARSESTVDCDRLANAWRKVVQKHSTLRTVFINSLSHEGKMDQIVLKKVSAKVVRQRYCPNALEALENQNSLKFSDAQPHHHFTICESDTGTVFCKLEMSHAICDGTSVPLLLRDLDKMYADQNAQPSSMRVYHDYISFLQKTSAELNAGFWRKYLENVESCHLPPLGGLRTEKELRTLSVQLANTSTLREFCSRNDVTLSTVLQLGWALVLSTYTGSKNVCFGYLSSGRDVPIDDIEDAVGLFISMLVCRMDCGDERIVNDALAQIREDHARSMAHQGSSLGDMQHEVGLSGRSLFNTAFTFQRRPASEDSNDAVLTFDILEAYDPSEYDFTVNVEACGDSVEILFNYWTNHTCAAQAQHISETFESAIESMTGSGASSLAIGNINMCGEKQKQKVLDWNHNQLPLVDRCVHDVIYRQSQNLPMSTPAISSWDGDLTYIKLMSLSKRLSKHLVATGIRPGKYVALCFEKSSWAVVAMLGVLNAGAAFVPVEPSHPENRIRFIINNIQANLVLCSSKYSDKFVDYEGVQSLVVDEDLNQQPLPSKEAPVLAAKTTDPAYLIFTSGTTGLPKGTIISHRAFSTSAAEHAPAILMRQKSRVLQFSNLCFDASIMEILTSLSVGACVCIPSDEERMNNIPGAISRMSVNWTLLTPSVANVLKPESCPSLKVLVTGGEAMQARHIAKWRDSTSLVNAYGPSEAAVIATTSIKVDDSKRVIDEDPTVIGYPVGCRGWIVDPNNHHVLMPIGSIGELVLEGYTLADGYLNNEEKTAKAFVQCPKWMSYESRASTQEKPKKLYKTGDLVRYNPDGSIVYCTRKDTQIKLNGLRIELGEIEHHVKHNFPETMASAVAMVAPAGQESAIAVFFVPQSKQSLPDAADEDPAEVQDTTILPIMESDATICKDLKKDLAGALPTYMIPSLYFPISRIPWTSSGKLDQLRLCKMVAAMSKEDVVPFKLAKSSQKRSPVSEMEKSLAKIWETILSLDAGSATLDDSFFVLGGDSVQAMKLVAAARVEKISISTLDIFRKPTLWEMADACDSLSDEDETITRPFGLIPQDEIDQVLEEVHAQCSVEKSDVVDAYPCSALQEGLITLSIKQPGAYVNQNIFRLPGAVDLDQFKSAWQAAVDEVDILRTRILHTNDSSFLQIVLKQENIEWLTMQERDEALTATSLLPGSNGSKLMSFAIVESTNGYEFVWSIHHALYDGWSMPKMLQRVEEIYFEDNQALPGASISHFMQYLAKVDNNACSQFWKTRFEDLESVHFPKISSTETQSGTTDTLKVTLDLPQRSTGTGITLPTIIRAAWALILSGHTSSNDVVFGEVLTGRDVPVEGIIDILGPTLTTVPTRVRKNDGQTVGQYLQDISRMATDVIPYQHAGLQNIRRLNAETATACDFQNLLVIQTAGEDSETKLWEPLSEGVGSNFFTYPLVVECNMGESNIFVDAHYNKHIMSEWHVRTLLQQLEVVMVHLCKESLESQVKLDEVEIISRSDIETIQGWNDYELTTVDACIHDLFLKQAKRRPSSEAVCAWDGTFSYDELRRQALGLSQYLTSVGVSSGSLVPFCMDKSRWAVVAQLAVMLTGAAIVPFDPAHPSSRHAEIAQDIEAEVILCSPQHQSRYADMVRKVIPVAAQTFSDFSHARQAQVSQNATCKDPAYVIFTSGSTGKPKGVVVEHRAFCSSSAAYSEAMLMDPRSRVFNFASVTFDVGLMENLSPLTMGGTVCIPNNESKMTNLAASIDSLKATWAFLTPSVANLIEPSAVPSLKVLVCGGEAMTQENVTKWADKLTLVNGYGPTEASVISVVNPNVSKEKDASSIGHAHSAGYTWIADTEDYNRLTPLGCVGELLLEGPLLAREYLKDPQKTAAAFVENPRWSAQFSNDSNESRRLYRTGDLAKFNPDGSVVYLGRKDNQVKLHGQRIELGEIEHKLEIYSHIRHAVVLVPKSGLCKQRLVAAVSIAELCQESKASAATRCKLLEASDMELAQVKLEEVKIALSTQLPPYMIPTLYFIVEAIPLLVSGKLDRKQVEKWLVSIDEATYNQVTGAENDLSDGAPITETVQNLREIWASVFNIPIDAVNPNQSFISQGGDSLISMSIIARCRKHGITLSLQEILQSKSLHQVAQLVESRGASMNAKRLATTAEKEEENFELSPVQQLYFQLKGTSRDHTRFGRFNQSQLLRLKTRVTPENLQKAIALLVQQHSMFRARFSKNQAGVWQQRISKDIEGSCSFQYHKIRRSQDLIEIQAQNQMGLDIETGPLVAVALIEEPKNGQVLSIIAHHLVIDVVSWNIIMQQLEEVLTDPTSTIEKPLSFQTWCKLQKDHASSRESKDVKVILPFKTKRADMGFWDMAQLSNTYGSVTHETFTLDKAATKMVIGDANNALHTQPLEIFLAALIKSFAQVFPQRSPPSIWNESHGRDAWDTSIDITGTTGWFTSLYPISVPDETSRGDPVELLKWTKDLRRSLPGNGREYFAHRYLTPDGKWRFGDHMPMEILLNYTGQAQQGESQDSLFGPVSFKRSDAEEKQIADVGPETTRMALFEISVGISSGETQFSFMYNKNMRYQTEIREWIVQCQRTIRDLLGRLSSLAPQPTLSDYKLLPTTYDGLGKHVKETFREIGISSLDQVEDMYVTAPTQEGLLLSQLRTPGQYINYVISEAKLAQARSKIDVPRLVRAWQKVVDRHQSLRTAFVYSVCKGHAFDQIALKQAKGDAKVIRCADDEFEEAFAKVSLQEINKTRRPQLPHQLSICSTTSGRTYLKLELNHAVIDGGSGALITRDLALAYEGRLPGGPKPLYSDYVRYISGRLEDGGDIPFWKEYLKGAERCHLQKLDPASADDKRLNAIYLHFTRFTELGAFCRANDLTLSNVMLLAWGLVLRQYTGRDDVCFGNLTAGRDAPVDGIQDTVGAFINMLICRIKFGGSSNFKEMIRQLQSDYLGMLPHQHCSLAKLQHDLGFSGESLFNTAVSIQNQISTRDAEKEGDAIEIDPLTDYDPTEYAVTVNIRSAPGDEGARIKHWVSHVSIEEAEKMTETYADILGAILDQSSNTLSQFDSVRSVDVPTKHLTKDRAQPTKKPDHKQESPEKVVPNAVPPKPITSEVSHLLPQPDSSSYRNLIKECVQEALQELIRSGGLIQLPDHSSDINGLVNRRIDDQAGNNMNGIDGERLKSASEETLNQQPSSDSRAGLLLSLWAPLLHMDEAKIHPEDSFFALGGDSILAMELARAAREAGYSLTVADIFGTPVFSKMLALFVTRKREYGQFNDDVDSASSTENENVVDPEQPNRFSLLETTNKEAFINDYICPRVGVFRGGVVDAFPTSDYQAFALAGHLVQARWAMNHIFFDGDGILDLVRVRKSATKIVDTFDILRTVFIPCGNKFLQVVLRTIRPDIQVHETDKDFETFTKELTDPLQSSAPRLGESYIRISIIRKTGSLYHRILLRLSHAQYDGVCLPRIIEAFKAAYEGRPVLASAPFCDFILQSSGSGMSGHYDYWKELLIDSSMTQVVLRQHPNYKRTEMENTTLRKLIKVPSLTSKNVTTATVVKTAWALTLAKLLGKSDIVFGNLISGRNAPVEDVESIVGPCLNIIPVRVDLQSNMSALELLRRVQSQQVASMPFENLGFREIIQNCTDWPEWAYFSSIVQHQNLAEDVALTLDRTRYKVGAIGAQDTLTDVMVGSTPKKGDMLEIAMGFVNDGSIPISWVERALELTCTLARNLAGNPNKSLSSIPDGPAPNFARMMSYRGRVEVEVQEELLDFNHREVSDVMVNISRAWKAVLYRGPDKPISNLDLETSFYDVGGDLVSLASLASILNGQGHDLRLEDLIHRPRLGSQVSFFLTKMAEKAKAESQDPPKYDDAVIQSKGVFPYRSGNQEDAVQEKMETNSRETSSRKSNKTTLSRRSRFSQVFRKKR